MGEDIRRRHPFSRFTGNGQSWVLWHGANWTFVLWGLYHATLITNLSNDCCAQHKISLIGKNLWRLGNNTTFKLLGGYHFVQSVVSMQWQCSTGLILRDYLWLGMRENTYLVAAMILILCIVTGPSSF